LKIKNVINVLVLVNVYFILITPYSDLQCLHEAVF